MKLLLFYFLASTSFERRILNDFNFNKPLKSYDLKKELKWAYTGKRTLTAATQNT